ALRAVGGFEIAGLVGAALEAAARRMVVVLDGFISSVAGLLAAALEPAARAYFVAGHRSVEAGQRVVLVRLELAPLLELGLRLLDTSWLVCQLGPRVCSESCASLAFWLVRMVGLVPVRRRRLPKAAATLWSPRRCADLPSRVAVGLCGRAPTRAAPS